MSRQATYYIILPSILSLLALLLSACGRTVTPTPFVPPTRPVIFPTLQPLEVFTSIPLPALSSEVGTAVSNDAALPSPTPPCTNSLKFVQDVTIPDDTVVAPSSTIDKRWLVENDGTCNWDSHYRLKFTGGSEMGVATEQALYPARAGTQAVIQISFIAPTDPGVYRTAWQGYAPDGTPFGNTIYMEIVVQQ
jgi:hypothetical protein